MENEDLIKKWLHNDLSEAEENAFEAMEDSGLYKEIVQEAKRFKADDAVEVLPFEEFKQQLPKKQKPKNIHWLKVASRIAAVFVIGLAVYSILNINKVSTYSTEYAQNKLVKLPDNSIVNLNELSNVKFNVSNWDEKRTLDLSGEAFFDVEKGEKFNVNTDQGIVSVLGTEFNVLSRDSIFKVSCYEGLVKVTYNDKSLELPVGTEFTLVNGHAEKSTITVSEPYWIKNMSVFENTSIKNVMFELEKQYKIKVRYTSEDDVKFTGAFEHGNLENALKSVTQPLNLTYMIQNDEVIISNAKN